MLDDREKFRFERVPEELNSPGAYILRRTPHDRQGNYVSVSADFIGIRTHFFNKRTCPCLKFACPACDAGNRARWNGYLLVVDKKDQMLVIFEFTSRIVRNIDDHIKLIGTMRGTEFLCFRPSGKVNGGLSIQIKGVHPKATSLPKDVPIWPILSHIWGIKESAVPQHEMTEDDNSLMGVGKNEVASLPLPGQRDIFAEEVILDTAKNLSPSRNGGGKIEQFLD